MNLKVLTLGAAAALLLSAPAGAAVTLFSNATGLSAPQTTLTFSEVALPNGTAVTNQYSAFGVGFVNAFQLTNYGFTPSPNLTNFASVQHPNLEILFSGAVTEAAFILITNFGTTAFEAFLSGQLVGSGSLASDSAIPHPYYGFTGGSFDRIRITAPQNQAMVIDNLQIGAANAVPEPSTWAMLIAGFALAGAALRRGRPGRGAAIA